MDFTGEEWLDAIHASYGREITLPVLVAAELLIGRGSPAEVSASLTRRNTGERTITAEAVSDAVTALIQRGFFEVVFAASSPEIDGAEEQVLELRIPA